MTPDADRTRTADPDLTRTAGQDDATGSGQPAPEPETRPGGGDAARPASDAPPGFAIERELGVGGMGVVFLARQAGLNRPVALKFIQVGDSGSLLRFLAEAEAMAAVRHPNVAEVHQFGEHHGRPFLALEYCPGGDLTATYKAGRLSPTVAAELLAAIADGVAAAHAAGVVHRDLKPHNLFLTATGPGGRVKVGDCGLAKAFDAAGLSGLTRTGRAAGTPSFVPRQQVIDFKNARPEVDVWALAATLHCLLSGRPPRDFPTGRDPWLVVLRDAPVPVRLRNPSVPSLAELLDVALADQGPLAYVTCDQFRSAFLAAV